MTNQALAIAGPPSLDSRLVDELAARRPHAVTVLIEASHDGGRWAWDETAGGRARRDRLAGLLTAVELATGAAVVGTIGSADRLADRRFDAIVAPGVPAAA